MKKKIIIDAEYYPIREGQSEEEIKSRRRKQFWTATGKFLALESFLIAAAVIVGARLW